MNPEISPIKENSPIVVGNVDDVQCSMGRRRARWLSRRMEALEAHGVGKLIRARRGVVLATGAFIHNRRMVAEFLPQHLNGITMGWRGIPARACSWASRWMA